MQVNSLLVAAASATKMRNFILSRLSGNRSIWDAFAKDVQPLRGVKCDYVNDTVEKTCTGLVEVFPYLFCGRNLNYVSP